MAFPYRQTAFPSLVCSLRGGAEACFRGIFASRLLSFSFSAHSPDDAFRRPVGMPFSAFSALSGLRRNIAGGSETTLRQVFRGEAVFYGGFRKLSPKPLEQCYGSSGVLLRRSWSNATAAPEKPYGPSAKRTEGPCVWLEVPYEAVLGWLSVRNTRIYDGERSVDAKYSSIGKGVVKIIQLFP